MSWLFCRSRVVVGRLDRVWEARDVGDETELVVLDGGKIDTDNDGLCRTTAESKRGGIRSAKPLAGGDRCLKGVRAT